MKNLIGMTDFVLDQEKIVDNSGDYRIFKKAFNLCEKYAKFLKQPLELWMFVPCDEDGNVLKKTIIEKYQFGENEIGSYEIPSLEYEQAKERCLFVWQKGFDYKVICEMFKDLEDIILFEFELTETAQKQIFG